MRQYLHNIFALDPRSLILFRIGLGILLAFDSICRIPNLEIFYSDAGVVTRVDLINKLEFPSRMTLLALNGDYYWGLLIALLGVGAGLALIFGYHVRLAKIIGWLSLCAFHARNPLLAHGGDNLLRLSFFYSLFLPTPNRNESKTPQTILTPWSVAFTFQVFFIYIFTTIYKLDPDWTDNFSAVYYALQLDSYRTFIGDLINGPIIMSKLATIGTMLLEGFGIFLLFIPWKQNLFRMLGVLIFILFHLSIGLSFHVGIFSTTCMLVWIAHLPSSFWDFIKRKAPPSLNETEVVSHFSPSRKVSLVTGSALITLVCSWNIEGLVGSDKFDIKRPITDVVFALQLNQQWNMFAPTPMRHDGWFVIKGTTNNGRTVDLLADDLAYSETKPSHMASRYPDSQWRKLLLNLRAEENSYFRGRLLNYFCKKWNNNEKDSIASLELFFMRERTANIETPNEPIPIEPISLWVKTCD